MNRREQNRALKDWGELKRLIAVLDPLVVEVLRRGTFSSGEFDDIKQSANDPERGTQATSYADPTGEEAIKRERSDRVEIAVTAIAKNVALSVSFAKWILQGVPETTDEAIRREIPSCAGCDRPVFGRVKAGYHQECYDRKRYLKIADRAEFRRVRMAEVADADQHEVTAVSGPCAHSTSR